MNTASVARLSPRVSERIQRAAQSLGEPSFYLAQYPRLESAYAEVKSSLSRLLGAPSSHFALVSSTSEGLSKAVRAIPGLAAKSVVFAREGFVSVGASARFSGAGSAHAIGDERGVITVSELAALPFAVDALVVEWVNYKSGAVNDIECLSAWCRARGALLIVDAVQGLGAAEMRFSLENVDALACGAHKWLLGAEGAGFLYVGSRLLGEATAPLAGYRSVAGPDALSPDGACHFETGTLSLLSFAGFAEALRELEEQGLVERERRVAANSLALRALLGWVKGVELFSSGSAVSGIVSFRVSGLPSSEVVSALALQGLIAKERDGFVRLSPPWNADMKDVLARLERLFTGRFHPRFQAGA